jgi:outer membrane lipoprotein-sorting protein
VAKDYTTIRGHILMRKPEMLRVLGQVPVLGSRLFDMASDGKNFTLYIPSKSMAVKGPNEVRKKSANRLENLRPGFFLDAMVVRGLEPDDLYSVITDSETIEDEARKHLFEVPEYTLSISRRNSDSRQLTPVRVVVFRRDDLMPYQQSIFDKDGNLETQVEYADYQDFDSNKYPSRITIKRPLEEYQIVLTVEKVEQNQPLTDDQFQIKIPEGTKIQNLE